MIDFDRCLKNGRFALFLFLFVGVLNLAADGCKGGHHDSTGSVSVNLRMAESLHGARALSDSNSATLDNDISLFVLDKTNFEVLANIGGVKGEDQLEYGKTYEVSIPIKNSQSRGCIFLVRSEDGKLAGRADLDIKIGPNDEVNIDIKQNNDPRVGVILTSDSIPMRSDGTVKSLDFLIEAEKSFNPDLVGNVVAEFVTTNGDFRTRSTPIVLDIDKQAYIWKLSDTGNIESVGKGAYTGIRFYLLTKSGGLSVITTKGGFSKDAPSLFVAFDSDNVAKSRYLLTDPAKKELNPDSGKDLVSGIFWPDGKNFNAIFDIEYDFGYGNVYVGQGQQDNRKLNGGLFKQIYHYGTNWEKSATIIVEDIDGYINDGVNEIDNKDYYQNTYKFSDNFSGMRSAIESYFTNLAFVKNSLINRLSIVCDKHLTLKPDELSTNVSPDLAVTNGYIFDSGYVLEGICAGDGGNQSTVL